ncbi:hypothetical protein BCR34DRAFT_89436 [Clohesyomyces aquaticus]|uniref:Short-chain dehydrogenase n=1 Tax=Clohesyomyces aquaticus TaxID=1231657 RepID=A0A1Y1YWX5_9PLEO|nr:hypothetical protein BCR34DRAFT_89436 [Clohesyomyces aquaticus]
MGAAWSQSFFIPTPTITSENCPDQTGRVFIVTGGYAGVGFELCQILYEHNATVYVAGRSQSKASAAISKIKNGLPKSAGCLEFLHIDLMDLSSVKSGAEAFLAQRDRLDVLVNNAGVMYHGNAEPRHNEIHIGTNCVGPSLLYKLLLPILTKTAASSPAGSVRVLWAGSLAVHVKSPKPGGMEVDEAGRPKDMDAMLTYGQTKVGNVFLAHTYSKMTPQTGVVHASFNPGSLNTELQRHWHGLGVIILEKCFLYPPIYGAYTELWAALTPELTPDRSGANVYPWGRFGSLPAGVEASLKESSEGGTGLAAKFISWVDAQTESYL